MGSNGTAPLPTQTKSKSPWGRCQPCLLLNQILHCPFLKSFEIPMKLLWTRSTLESCEKNPPDGLLANLPPSRAIRGFFVLLQNGKEGLGPRSIGLSQASYTPENSPPRKKQPPIAFFLILWSQVSRTKRFEQFRFNFPIT